MNDMNKTAQDVQNFIQNGDFADAVDLAKDILGDNPSDVYCLSVVAQSEFASGNLQEATAALIKALEVQPGEINLNRNLGIIYNKLGDFKQSSQCFLNGIENNLEHPEVLLDVLLLGISLDKVVAKQARNVIEFVFQQSFQLSRAYLNQEELPLISEASSIANHIIRNAKYKEQKAAIDEISLGFDESEKKRLYEFLDVFHGMNLPKYADELQKPSYHVFPDLEAIAFHDATGFSWTKSLEDNYQEIKQELTNLYQKNDDVKPYIDGGVTGNAELDGLANSLEWSSIHLVKAGDYRQDLLDQCPVTAKVLNHMPLPVLAGNAPEVFLSILKPGAEIKPHFGLSNIKLTVHLGLDIPENCAIRVGQETQGWSDGKVLVFDDSFEHEAWNRSDKERKVLIIEVWHPDLTALEKQSITKIMELQHAVTEVATNTSLTSLVSEIKTVI